MGICIRARDVKPGHELFNKYAPNPAFQWVRVTAVNLRECDVEIVTTNFTTVKHPEEGVFVLREEFQDSMNEQQIRSLCDTAKTVAVRLEVVDQLRKKATAIRQVVAGAEDGDYSGLRLTVYYDKTADRGYKYKEEMPIEIPAAHVGDVFEGLADRLWSAASAELGNIKGFELPSAVAEQANA